MHPSLTIDRILTTHEAAHWLSIIKPHSADDRR